MASLFEIQTLASVGSNVLSTTARNLETVATIFSENPSVLPSLTASASSSITETSSIIAATLAEVSTATSVLNTEVYDDVVDIFETDEILSSKSLDLQDVFTQNVSLLVSYRQTVSIYHIWDFIFIVEPTANICRC